MQRYWPHATRFDAENFGFQPTWLILQALEHGAKLQCEQLHHQELGIATLTSAFINANRDPKKGEPAKASDFYYFQPKDQKIKVPAPACDTFFALTKENKLPGWAVAMAPMDILRANKGNGKPLPGRVRAWVGKGILLIMPIVDGDTVRCPLAFISTNRQGSIALNDVDTNTLFRVQLPPGERRWVLDAEFTLAKSHLEAVAA